MSKSRTSKRKAQVVRSHSPETAALILQALDLFEINGPSCPLTQGAFFEEEKYVIQRLTGKTWDEVDCQVYEDVFRTGGGALMKDGAIFYFLPGILACLATSVECGLTAIGLSCRLTPEVLRLMKLEFNAAQIRFIYDQLIVIRDLYPLDFREQDFEVLLDGS